MYKSVDLGKTDISLIYEGLACIKEGPALLVNALGQEIMLAMSMSGTLVGYKATKKATICCKDVELTVSIIIV